MKSAVKVMEQIKTQAMKSTSSLREVKSIEIGQAVRQGDLYIQRLADDAPHENEAHPQKLAVGETKGSRHVVEGDVEVYKRSGDALTGPLIIAKQSFTVTHPEHAHFSLPAGTYGVTYQRDYSVERAEEIRRVAD